MICFNFVNSYTWSFFKFNYIYCVINYEWVSVTSAYLFDGWFDSEGNIQSRLSFYPKNKQKPVYQRNQHKYIIIFRFHNVSSNQFSSHRRTMDSMKYDSLLLFAFVSACSGCTFLPQSEQVDFCNADFGMCINVFSNWYYNFMTSFIN